MDHIKALLNDLTTEAAIADMPVEGPNEHLEEAMMAAGDTTGPTIASLAENAQRAGDLGDHLGEIGDRAEVIEAQVDAAESPAELAVAEASTEGLIREYATTIRAYDVAKPWHSYTTEAAQSTKERLVAIKTDARKFAGVSHQVAHNLGDVSNEATDLSRALFRHKSKLTSARTALQVASAKANSKASELAEHPYPIKNSGFARFLTRENVEVTNLPAAIKAEAAWLQKAHGAIVSAAQALQAAAHKVKANPEIEHAIDASALRGVRELATTSGFLMGNFTVEVKKDHPLVQVYTRKQKDVHTSVGSRAAAGAAGALGWYNGGNAAGFLGLVIGGFSIGMLAGVAGAAGLAIAAGKGASGYVKDRSKVTSIATAADMKHVFTEVLGYEKFVDLSLDTTLMALLDDVASNKVKGSKAASDIHDAMWNLHVLAEIIYDQVFYTTTHLAALANKLG